MAQLLAKYGGIDAQLLGDLLAQFIAHDPAGDALDVRQKIVHRFLFAFGSAHRKVTSRAVDQIVEILL